MIYAKSNASCVLVLDTRSIKIRAMSSRQKKGSTDDTLPEMDPWLSLAPPLQDLGVPRPGVPRDPPRSLGPEYLLIYDEVDSAC